MLTRSTSGSRAEVTYFKALKPGEVFLFKLKKPYKPFIAGGGFFTHSSLLPVSLAWEAFGEKNGAATFQEMRQKIAGFENRSRDPHEDFQIGCILLQQPFFLPKQNGFRSQATFIAV